MTRRFGAFFRPASPTEDRIQSERAALLARFGGLPPVGTILRPVCRSTRRFGYLFRVVNHGVGRTGDFAVLQVLSTTADGQMIGHDCQYRDDIRLVKRDAYRCTRYRQPCADDPFAWEPPYFRQITIQPQQLNLFDEEAA